VSEHLLSAFLDELAERVAARLSGGEPHAQIQRSPDPWRLWTLEETAQRLTRSERWVRERAKQGELPFVRWTAGRSPLIRLMCAPCGWTASWAGVAGQRSSTAGVVEMRHTAPSGLCLSRWRCRGSLSRQSLAGRLQACRKSARTARSENVRPVPYPEVVRFESYSGLHGKRP